MTRRFRDFRLYSDNELRSLEDKLIPTVVEWARGWLAHAQNVKVCCVDYGAKDVRGLSPEYWREYVSKNADCIVEVAVNAGMHKAFCSAMVGDCANFGSAHFPLSPVISEVVFSGIDDLVSMLAGESLIYKNGGDGAAVKCMHDFGSGAVLCHVYVDEGRFNILLSSTLIRRMGINRAKPEADRTPVCSLSDALSKRRTHIDVLLGQTELSLKQLCELRIGDVVVFKNNVRDPFQLCIQNGEAITPVHLGLQNSYVAAFVTGIN